MADPADTLRPTSPRGAFQLVYMVLSEAVENKVHVRSGFLALWCLEAVIPLLLLVAAAAEPLGYDGAIVEAASTLLTGSIFGDTADELTRYLTDLLTSATMQTLGVTGIVAGLFITWQLFAAALFDLRELQWRAWDLGGLSQIPRFAVFCVWVVALLGGGVAVSVSLLGGGHWYLLPVPVLWGMVLIALAIKWAGGRDRTWRGALVGGLVGALWWELLKTALRLYAVSSFGTDALQTTYSALGFLPLFFLWMHLTWFSVLLAVMVARIHDSFEPTWRAWLRRKHDQPSQVFPDARLAVAAAGRIRGSGGRLLSDLADALDVHPDVAHATVSELKVLGVVDEPAPNTYRLCDDAADDDAISDAWDARHGRR